MNRTSSIFLLVSALASSSAFADPDPTTTWTDLKLAEGERLGGQVPDGKGGVKDEPAHRWISPSGHAVMIAPVWTKDRLVVRATWNDPKPRTQDVVVIPGPISATKNPFYNDHPDGQLVLSVGGSVGGANKSFAYRLAFDPKRGFKVVKKAENDPDWLQSRLPIGNLFRAHSFGGELRMNSSMHNSMKSQPVTIVTRKPGSTAKPVEETLPAEDLVKRWDASGRRPAVGFGAKCNDKDNCCTYDDKKLGAWLHVERICFVDNKPGKVFLVEPK